MVLIILLLEWNCFKDARSEVNILSAIPACPIHGQPLPFLYKCLDLAAMMADSSKLFGRTRRVSTTMQERIRRFEVSNSSSEAMEISGHGLKDEKKDKFEDTERHRQNARVTEIATDHEHEVGK